MNQIFTKQMLKQVLRWVSQGQLVIWSPSCVRNIYLFMGSTEMAATNCYFCVKGICGPLSGDL